MQLESRGDFGSLAARSVESLRKRLSCPTVVSSVRNLEAQEQSEALSESHNTAVSDGRDNIPISPSVEIDR